MVPVALLLPAASLVWAVWGSLARASPKAAVAASGVLGASGPVTMEFKLLGDPAGEEADADDNSASGL